MNYFPQNKQNFPKLYNQSRLEYTEARNTWSLFSSLTTFGYIFCSSMLHYYFQTHMWILVVRFLKMILPPMTILVRARITYNRRMFNSYSLYSYERRIEGKEVLNQRKVLSYSHGYFDWRRKRMMFSCRKTTMTVRICFSLYGKWAMFYNTNFLL